VTLASAPGTGDGSDAMYCSSRSTMRPRAADLAPQPRQLAGRAVAHLAAVVDGRADARSSSSSR
jgi:hypothetical protein